MQTYCLLNSQTFHRRLYFESPSIPKKKSATELLPIEMRLSIVGPEFSFVNAIRFAIEVLDHRKITDIACNKAEKFCGITAICLLVRIVARSLKILKRFVFNGVYLFNLTIGIPANATFDSALPFQPISLVAPHQS